MEDGKVKAGVWSVECGRWKVEGEFPGFIRRPVPSITDRIMQIGVELPQ